MDYQKVYTQLVSKRTDAPLKKSKKLCTELHHIIPRCLGGSDDKENLVRLTAREHFIAHRLLAKIHPNNHKLALALLMMYTTRDAGTIPSKEIERVKGVAFEVASTRLARLWREDEFREMMTVLKSKLWENAEYRSKMVSAISLSTRKMWRDTAFREKMSRLSSERLSAQHKDPNFRDLMRNKREEYLKENSWPWQRGKGQKTKYIWGLAASFKELRDCNPTYSASDFSKDFCSGMNESIFKRMLKMFREGWDPVNCEEYVAEFGDIM